MNKDWQQIDKQILWHPYSTLEGDENLLIERGEGIYLITADGRKLIDAVSSWWVNIHGHAHPYIVEKMTEQAKELEHVMFAGFTHKPGILLAERLLQLLPNNFKRVFYSDNGSTSVEVALKMAIQCKKIQGGHTHRIIALEGAFHGDTFGAMAVSARGAFSAMFDKYMFEVSYVPFPEEELEALCLAKFEQLIVDNKATAFIYEPLVQGASGMRVYSPEVLNKMLALAKKHDVLCIADEVFTGFGRTGKIFASDYMPEKPDIICLSKGITGGFMPFAATICNEKVERSFLGREKANTFFHGHSYTGNPIACAVANASLDILLGEGYLENLERINKSHVEFAEKIKGNKAIGRVHVLGTILSFEIKSEAQTGYFNALREKLYQFFLTKNIILRPLGNILYLIPPYVIKEEELSYIYTSIFELLLSLEN